MFRYHIIIEYDGTDFEVGKFKKEEKPYKEQFKIIFLNY